MNLMKEYEKFKENLNIDKMWTIIKLDKKNKII